MWNASKVDHARLLSDIGLTRIGQFPNRLRDLPYVLALLERVLVVLLSQVFGVITVERAH